MVAAIACLVIPGPGASVGFAVAGSVGLVSGLWTLSARPWRATEDGTGPEVWRAWMGLTIVCGAAALLVGSWAFFTTSAAAVIVSTAVGIGAFAALGTALVTLVRSGVARHLTVRLGLDCVVAAASMTFLVWAADTGRSVGYRATADVVVALVVMALHLLFLVAVGLAAVRQKDRGAWAGAAGLALMSAAVMLAEHDMVTGEVSGKVWATACWTLAFPLLAVGVRRYRPAGRARFQVSDADLRDARVSAGISMAAVLCAVSAVALLWLNRELADRSGWLPLAFTALIGLAFAAHEATNATARYRVTRRLLDLAFLDPLTDLANRRALGAAIAELPDDEVWSLIDLDLDGFKQLNEVHGHELGDDVLVAVARELTTLCPRDSTVARIGGDEFAVLALADLPDAEALAERILGRLRDLLGRLGAGLPLSVSLGVGLVNRPGHAAEAAGDDGEGGAERLSALADAAAALHSAQLSGHNQVAVYTGAVAVARERGKLVERCLPAAIQRHEITAHGQVVVRLSDGQVSTVEALARWTSPELGPVRPDEFIPFAERGGALIGALGSHVLRYSARQAVDSGLVAAGVRLSVNVSPVQLRNPQFVPLVRAVLEETGIPPGLLVLEVTEQVLVDDDAFSVVLVHLKDLGVSLAIDDFGAGYSALGYLRRIPMDVLKIDRQWTVDAQHDKRTRDVVASVTDLAHRLGALVVMEGVEDAALAAMCRELGADLAQGWHFGRPEPFDVLAPKALQHNASVVT